MNEVRSSLAAYYLERTDLTVAQVAFRLGFADQSTFTHAFRTWTGLSPVRFRQRSLAAGDLDPPAPGLPGTPSSRAILPAAPKTPPP